jgi:hypothetical protein
MFRGWIRESYDPIHSNDHNTIGQLGDDRTKLLLFQQTAAPPVRCYAPVIRPG